MNGLALLVLMTALGQDATLDYRDGALEWTVEFDAKLLRDLRDGSEAESRLQESNPPRVERFRLRVRRGTTNRQRREVIASQEEGIELGWEPNGEGGSRFIVQMTPTFAEWFESGEYEITDVIDPSIPNVHDLVIRIGTEAVPRLIESSRDFPKRAPGNTSGGMRSENRDPNAPRRREEQPSRRDPRATDNSVWPINRNRSAWDVFGSSRGTDGEEDRGDPYRNDSNDSRYSGGLTDGDRYSNRTDDDDRPLSSEARDSVRGARPYQADPQNRGTGGLSDTRRTSDRRTNEVGYKPADRIASRAGDPDDARFPRVARSSDLATNFADDDESSRPDPSRADSDDDPVGSGEVRSSADDHDRTFGLSNSRSKESSTKKKGREDRSESPSHDPSFGPLLMFFLCASLGVNIYLIWINRGFYHRYHGLLAEMRSSAGG